MNVLAYEPVTSIGDAPQSWRYVLHGIFGAGKNWGSVARRLVAARPDWGALLVDPLKITQVLENLIDNALKYTPKGSRIEVATRLHGAEIEVSVCDNGPGIPEEALPHIFERFYRVDKGRSREKGGTGLGLSIVKHIVQLHGGRVWAESRLGKGTTFYFSLPVRTTTGPVDGIDPARPAKV